MGLIGRFDAFHPKGREFKSRSSGHVGNLGKSLPHSCLQLIAKLRHDICAVSGAPLSSSGLKEAPKKYPEWMNEWNKPLQVASVARPLHGVRCWGWTLASESPLWSYDDSLTCDDLWPPPSWPCRSAGWGEGSACLGSMSGQGPLAPSPQPAEPQSGNVT